MNRLLQELERKPTYPIGKVNGVTGCSYDEDDFDSSESEDEAIGPYEQEFVQKELKLYAEQNMSNRNNLDDASSYGGNYSMVDDMEHIMDRKNNPIDIYSTYNFRCNTDIRKELPIDSYKERILTNILINQVVVIQGPTGCGKTTQVAQYILDDFKEKAEFCNIAVTQPRKIATINVAKRVCEERGWTLGTVCGYQVGLERRVSPDMLLTYMTTGVLLQKLIGAKTLREYTHIIIDEVHERNQELDFLLLVVRKFLFTNSPQTKIILMSATIDAEKFAHYFRTQSREETISAPIIQITKPGQFNKTVFYLESVHQIAKPIPKFDIDKPEILPKIWEVFLFLVKIFDKLDSDDGDTTSNKIGSVLVFLPGIYEIEEANKLLNANNRTGEKNKEKDPIKWDIVPLHSSLPNDEQAKAFRPQRPGCRKIILSTNIAESSVTVPDTLYVIDFCLTKVMTIDPLTKYMSLKLEWASHVNCEQRAGRVGRVRDGRIYRLVPREFYNEEMTKQSVPEILRGPLDRIVLQAKMLNMSETPAQILALALNPPNLKNIDTTIWHLKEAGGLLITCNGIHSNCDGDITFLGQVMAKLPISVNLAKFIVLGQLYSCLEESIIIAAGCSIQNIFSVPFQRRLEAYKKLMIWSDGSSSDLIALLNLYNVWQNYKRDNHFENHQSERQWCQLNLVSLKGLKEWSLLVAEIKARLERMNIKETHGDMKVMLNHAEKTTVLMVLTAGAFYPNYFLKVPGSGAVSEREAVKTVGGRDPFSTIYFTGMDHNQPVQVYIRPIKRLLFESDDREVDVQIGHDGSSKVFIEFKNYNRSEPISVNVDGNQMLITKSNKIPLPMYLALRKRQLKYPFDLKVLPSDESWKFAEEHGLKRHASGHSYKSGSNVHCFSPQDYSPIPGLDVEYITLNITSHIDAGHFWAQNCDEQNDTWLAAIDDALNKQVLQPVEDTVKRGKCYAAKYLEDNLFYRCKVISSNGNIVTIIFIDYGNMQQVNVKELYNLPQRPQCQVAPLAIDCVMYGIQPTKSMNPQLIWSTQANNLFRRMTQGVVLNAKVYSVVGDVVHLELFVNANSRSINEELILRGFAQEGLEGFLSNEDHEKRLLVQQADSRSKDDAMLNVNNIVSYSDFQAPVIRDKYKTLQLKGPYSPLEMKLYCCTQSGSHKSVDVESNSVNAVLLDSEPDSKYSRLMVASYVGQSADEARLKLRQTTAMPSIPGLPMLLSLLFCPTMEPKVNDECTRVCSILCGLGYNEFTGKTYYPQHDMVITLDTQLNAEEIETINKLRYLMSSGVKLMYGISQNMSAQEELLTTQSNIKSLLFDLMYMRRTPVDRTSTKHENIWGRLPADVVTMRPNMPENAEDIWNLLWFVKLRTVRDYDPLVSKNLEDMDNMIHNVTPVSPILCKLCHEYLVTVYDIRFHLISDIHKENLNIYLEKLQYDDDDDEYED